MDSPPHRDVVLIVEDDAIATEVEREALAREGIGAHSVGSVGEALSALATTAFSAVLLDYSLPDGDPWPVIAAARAKTPRVPVILVTATGNEAIAAEALHRGAADYTVKGGDLWARLPVLVQRVVAAARIEERQRRDAARFELVAQHSSDVIATFDLAGRFTYVSPAVIHAYGETPEELIGERMIERVHPLDRERVQRSLRVGIASPGRVVRIELRRLRKDGSHAWVETQGTILRDPSTGAASEVISITRDITERRQASEALLRERAQLAEAQRLAQLGSWEWEIATDRVTWSAEVYRIFGLDPSFTPSVQGFVAHVHPDDRARVDAIARSAIEEPQVFEDEYRLVRPNGEVRFIHARGQVLLGEDGRPGRMMGTVHDITERKELARRLVITDRMAAIGTLAAGVAHEVNNPLASVIANLELLAQGLRARGGTSPAEGARELEEAVSQARDGAERVRKIVGGLRTFSRADDERRYAVSLHGVVEAAIDLASNEVRHRARLVKDFGSPPPVHADEARLAQVFVNLIVNAAQAIPAGMANRNEIRIVTRAGARGDAIVEVHDTGSGIPVALRDHVFNPFLTTKAIGGGAGLGLSICHGIVTSLGGEISFECPAGGGTIFRIVLPAATAVPAATAAAELPASQPSGAVARPTGRRGRVLLIDDDHMLLKVLGRVLAKEHEVTMLDDARLAWERLRGGEQFDAILCDLMMPNMTGMDLHAELARSVPEQAQRLVFMTGGTFTARGNEFLGEVPNQRFDKPFDTKHVIALVRGMVDARS